MELTEFINKLKEMNYIVVPASTNYSFLIYTVNNLNCIGYLSCYKSNPGIKKVLTSTPELHAYCLLFGLPVLKVPATTNLSTKKNPHYEQL